METTKTYHNGDEAQYTGATRHLHGATFFEVELLEGHRVGEIALTIRAPGIAATYRDADGTLIEVASVTVKEGDSVVRNYRNGYAPYYPDIGVVETVSEDSRGRRFANAIYPTGSIHSRDIQSFPVEGLTFAEGYNFHTSLATAAKDPHFTGARTWTTKEPSPRPAYRHPQTWTAKEEK